MSDPVLFSYSELNFNFHLTILFLLLVKVCSFRKISCVIFHVSHKFLLPKQPNSSTYSRSSFYMKLNYLCLLIVPILEWAEWETTVISIIQIFKMLSEYLLVVYSVLHCGRNFWWAWQQLIKVCALWVPIKQVQIQLKDNAIDWCT